MTNKKELNNEELEEVTGGCGEPDPSQLPKDHGRLLDKYETENYIGQEVYAIRKDEKETWGKGILKDSFEKETFLGTERSFIVYFTYLTDSMIGRQQSFTTKPFNTQEDGLLTSEIYAIYLAK